MKLKWGRPELIDLDAMYARGADCSAVCSPVGEIAAVSPEPIMCMPTGGDILPP